MADRSRFQDLALHIATGLNLRAAAERAAVPERTARRAVKNEKFLKLVRRARGRLWRSLAGKLTIAAEDAIDALKAIAGDDKKAATARVAAAGRLLDLALRYREAVDTERRLSALEAK